MLEEKSNKILKSYGIPATYMYMCYNTVAAHLVELRFQTCRLWSEPADTNRAPSLLQHNEETAVLGPRYSLTTDPVPRSHTYTTPSSPEHKRACTCTCACMNETSWLVIKDHNPPFPNLKAGRPVPSFLTII